MTKKEYLQKLSKVKVDEEKVLKVNAIYHTELPEILQKIISDNDETIFFDDAGRVISLEEMVEAEQDLHIDFKGKGIIPLIDCGENDFIVYHFRAKLWSKFNIIDETVFQKRESLEELLK